MGVGVPYRVRLPDWILKCSNPNKNAKDYIERNYPERYFIRIEKGFALCEML